MTPANQVVYLSNAGVLICLDGRKILIDALCNTDSVFKNPLPSTVAQIVNGEPPFDNIDAMLISHHHEDHFDAESVGRFMLNNKKTFLVSSAKVISLIRSRIPGGSRENLLELQLPRHSSKRLDLHGINILAVSLNHDGKMFNHVENYAFLIEGSRKIMHTGDAGATRENYAGLNLADQGIDLLLAPFPYIGLITARQVLKEYIRPRKTALLHLPREDRDLDGWIKATKKSYQSVAAVFGEAVFLEEIGAVLNL